jgi:hypothetical protein
MTRQQTTVLLEARNASRKATRYRDALTQFSKEMSGISSDTAFRTLPLPPG